MLLSNFLKKLYAKIQFPVYKEWLKKNKFKLLNNRLYKYISKLKNDRVENNEFLLHFY